MCVLPTTRQPTVIFHRHFYKRPLYRRPSMSNGVVANGASADQTHTASQRYLSTRGEDSGVCLPLLLFFFVVAESRIHVSPPLSDADHVVPLSSPLKRSSSRALPPTVVFTFPKPFPPPRTGNPGRIFPLPTSPSTSSPFSSPPPKSPRRTSRILSTGVTQPSVPTKSHH